MNIPEISFVMNCLREPFSFAGVITIFIEKRLIKLLRNYNH